MDGWIDRQIRQNRLDWIRLDRLERQISKIDRQIDQMRLDQMRLDYIDRQDR